MEIIEALNKYKQNMKEYDELNESIYNIADKLKWQDAMVHRAEALHRIFQENNEIIDTIKKYDSNDDDYNVKVFSAAINMFYEDYDDPEVLLPLFKKAINYYEKTNNVDSLIVFYNAMCYEETEYVYRLNGDNRVVSTYYDKVVAYKDSFKDFKLNRTRRLFVVNYYNYLQCLADKKETVDSSYKVYLDLIDFLENNKDYINSLSDEELPNIISQAKKGILVAEDVVDYANDETKKGLFEASKVYYDEELINGDNNVLNVDGQVYIAYLHTQAIFNNISYEDACDKYLDYYLKRREIITVDDETDEDDIYFLINSPIAIERLLNHVSDEKRIQTMEIVMNTLDSKWISAVNYKHETPFVNNLLALWCSETLKYCKNRKERENKILNLITKRQLPTYIHSYMVSTIVECLFDACYEARPDLFKPLGLRLFELREYVKASGLLHDIGKARICNIVNLVLRKLSDYEFVGIKNHPSFGIEIIDGQDDLEIYKDVILGHHKSYDGKNGYPDSFDNTKSKYRIIIDLITLADCIDAATDFLGRNYKTAKKVSDVIAEFVKDKGTKYNPVLVDIIANDELLLEQLDRITNYERIELMYQSCKLI